MLSIVVPVLNEARALPALFERLLPLSRHGCDVLFVDGGSTDESVAMIECAGFKVVNSQPGRAKQMNSGAAQAKGQALLFLHADTELPTGAVECVNQALAGDLHHWGRFDVRITGQHWMLRVVGHMMNLPDVNHLIDQGEGDLGERMARAAERVIAAGEAVLLMGTDCPQLDEARLQEAAQALQCSEATLIPAFDGGYVLLGLTRFDSSVFTGIAWSTDSVLNDTLNRLKQLGWGVKVLPTLHDVDEPSDLQWLPQSLIRVPA